MGFADHFLQSDAFAGPQRTHFIESPPFAVATQSSLTLAGPGHLSAQKVDSWSQESLALLESEPPLLEEELELEVVAVDGELVEPLEPLVAHSVEVCVAPRSPHDHVEPPTHAV